MGKRILKGCIYAQWGFEAFEQRNKVIRNYETPSENDGKGKANKEESHSPDAATTTRIFTKTTRSNRQDHYTSNAANTTQHQSHPGAR